MNALSSLSKHQFVKRIIGILIICIFLWNTSPATAELINYQASAGGYVVYDNVAQTYWMPLRNFAEMNMLGIANTISSYNNTFYYGISNWHLSTYNEFFQLTNHQSTQRAGEIASHFDMTRSELVEASLDVGDLICENTIFGTVCHRKTIQVPVTIKDFSGILDDEGLLAKPGTHMMITIRYFDVPPEYNLPGSADWLGDYLDDNAINHVGAWVTGTRVDVPEPATMLLFGLGLIGLARVRMKRS